MDNLNQNSHRLQEKKHWWFRTRRKVVRDILKYSKLDFNSSIFEIGCGTGGNLKYLFNGYNKIIGIDISKYAIKIAKLRNPKAKLIIGDANNLKNIKVSADLVVFLDVLCTKNILNVKNVLIESRKILKNNGYLLISEPAFNLLKGKHSKSVEQVRRFNLKEIEKEITACGYELVRSNYWGFSIFFFMLFKRTIIDSFLFKEEQNEFLITRFINKIFFSFQKLELFLFQRLKLPFGSSIIILGKKKQKHSKFSNQFTDFN